MTFYDPWAHLFCFVFVSDPKIMYNINSFLWWMMLQSFPVLSLWHWQKCTEKKLGWHEVFTLSFIHRSSTFGPINVYFTWAFLCAIHEKVVMWCYKCIFSIVDRWCHHFYNSLYSYAHSPRAVFVWCTILKLLIVTT